MSGSAALSILALNPLTILKVFLLSSANPKDAAQIWFFRAYVKWFIFLKIEGN